MNDVISRQAVLKIIDGWYENNRDTENIEDLIILITYMASVNPQEPKYCDRNICIKNEYNGIGCDECEVTKSQEPKTGHREYNDIYDHYLCGNCKTIVMDYDNFCPNCGCRMVEPQESEG